MNDRERFYRRTVAEQITNKDASILVCGAGTVDKRVFEDAGYTNVTMSNLDERMAADDFAPYPWIYANAEQLDLPERSYDYVVCHAVIHHTSSPHRMITEMYRVARLGALGIESRDSLLMRAMVRLGLAPSYEHTAVFYNDCQYGGVNNTSIPNYIYRWTEREIEKLIKTYAPEVQHHFAYVYGTALPATARRARDGGLRVAVFKMARPVFSLFTLLCRRQQNLFAFYVEKPRSGTRLHPWIKIDGGEARFDPEWGVARFVPPE